MRGYSKREVAVRGCSKREVAVSIKTVILSEVLISVTSIVLTVTANIYYKVSILDTVLCL